MEGILLRGFGEGEPLKRSNGTDICPRLVETEDLSEEETAGSELRWPTWLEASL